jgi:hypothetical protein
VKDTSLDLLAFGLPQVQQLKRYEERLQAGHRLKTLVLILTTSAPPPWATPLDGTRAVVLIGPDGDERRQILGRLRQNPEARDFGE